MMVTYLFLLFLFGFTISNTLGNTEIVNLHSSTPVSDVPPEFKDLDHHFSSVFPGFNEKIFHVNRNHMASFDCWNCTADTTQSDVWLTFDVTRSAIIPLSTTVRLSWSSSDAVEFDIAVFKPRYDQDSALRYVRIRPFRTDITGGSIHGWLRALGLGSIATGESGADDIHFHVKIEPLLWHVLPLSMVGPAAAITCLVIFGYFVLSPLAIRQFSMTTQLND